MNKSAAKEWLKKAWHNLSAAKLLYEANHYTDIIAIELHYACEKSLKAILAYENRVIKKTHDLVVIYKEIKDYINLNEKIFLLELISKYHIESSYPSFDRKLPPKSEIKEVLDFSFELFNRICKILDINKSELL